MKKKSDLPYAEKNNAKSKFIIVIMNNCVVNIIWKIKNKKFNKI